MTYRERRLNKAAKYEEWAEKREAKAAELAERNRPGREAAAISQPMDGRTVKRMQRGFDREVEHSRKAEAMRSKAANIKAQAEGAIYSDDPDAIERLEERIAELEAERDRIKAYNASCRKGIKTGDIGDVSLLSEEQRQQLIRTASVMPSSLGKNSAAPSYWLSNLNGNIARHRKRLEELRAKS